MWEREDDEASLRGWSVARELLFLVFLLEEREIVVVFRSMIVIGKLGKLERRETLVRLIGIFRVLMALCRRILLL